MRFDKSSLLLYAVTDRAWLGEETLAQQVERSLRGGATMVQIREKHMDPELFKAEALELKELCRRYNVPLIVNDDVSLALEIDADGVHVGQDDLEAGQARAKLGPDKILGVSVHTAEEARKAKAAGADYLGVGAVFPTGTKEDVSVLPRQTLQEICAAVDLPSVAIGGISAGNVLELTGSGVCGIAVVSAIYAQPDIEGAARQLLALAQKMVQG